MSDDETPFSELQLIGGNHAAVCGTDGCELPTLPPQASSIAAIEQGLLTDDPEFVSRMLRLHRAGTAKAIAVFTLLISSVVLLAVGLARPSHLAWFGGGLTFVATFAVARRYQRVLRS